MDIGLVEILTAILLLIWLAWISPFKTTPITFFHIEKVLVNVPKSIASSFIRDIANLPIYEQKVHSSHLRKTPQQQQQKHKHQIYTLCGGWCGLPWTATFDMRYTANGGFHSRIVSYKPGYKGVTASLLGIIGGFSLRDVGGGNTSVAHYEKYVWPGWYPLLWIPGMKGLWRKWHERGMVVEMQTIKIAMEAYEGNQGVMPEKLGRTLLNCHLTFDRYLREVVTGVKYALPDMSKVGG